MQLENINGAVFLKQNDTATEIHLRVSDSLGVPIDLSGQVLEVVIGNEVGRLLVKTPALLAGVGEISFGLDEGDLLPSGDQRLEVHIIEPDGERHVAPSKGFYKLRIQQSIDELQAEVTTVTLQSVLDEVTVQKASLQSQYDTFLTDAGNVIVPAQDATDRANQSAVNADSAVSSLELDKSSKLAEMDAKITATETVRSNTEAERLATVTVKDNTEAVRVATESVRISTNTVKTDTEAVRVATEAERVATASERSATTTVKNDTLTVKNDTLTVKADAATQASYAQTQGDYALAQGQAVDGRVTTVEGKLDESARATTTLATNTSVVSGGVDALASVEIEGRTLTSLGNSNLEATKQYVVADKKTKVIVQDGVSYTAPTTSGVAKFTRSTTSVATANYVGKVSGSTVVNPHIAKIEQSATILQSPSVGWDGELSSYSGLTTLNGSSVLVANSVNGGYAQQLFSFDIIAEIERKLGVIPKSTTADKVQWVKDNVENLTANWHGFGSSVGGNKSSFSIYRNDTSAWNAPTTHSNSTVSKLVSSVSMSSGVWVDANGFTHYLAYAEPSDGITASSVSTDFIDLVVTLKSTAQLNTRPTIIRVENFEGKVSGSVVENAHVAKRAGGQTSLQSPTGTWAEFGSGTGAGVLSYENLNSLNGIFGTQSGSINGAYAQQLFSFNLIEAVERNIGRIPRATVADKVTWLKANVSKITANWHGFGSSVGGNKASLKLWDAISNAWGLTQTHSSAVVTKLTSTGTSVNYLVDTNGFTHALASAEPSDGTTASTINTDYIDLEIELKPTADFTRPKVALYEVDATQYGKILVDYDADEVVRRFPIVEGTQHLQGVGVTAEGENLLPPFTEWTLHANAKVVSPYELEHNGTGNFQQSSVNINVIPNQTYYGTTENSRIVIQWLDGSGNSISFSTAYTSGSGSFTAPSNAKQAEFLIDNNTTTGVKAFKNPMLTLGSTAKPFVPRNTSSFLADVKLGSIGTSKDVLYESEGNRFVRKVVEKDVVLGGDLAWTLLDDQVGFKRVKYVFTGGLDNNANAQRVAKFNGNLLLPRGLSTSESLTSDHSQYNNTNGIFITASDTDTGFGETYTPSTAEIKAYFYGYQMNNGTFGTPYNGTGTKTWIPLGDTANTRAVTVVPTSASPTQVDGTIKPYMLSYILATPQTVNVTDKVEGQMKVNGSTQVSVESGVVRREKVVPKLYSGEYFINFDGTKTPSLLGDELKLKANSIMSVHKNTSIDKGWSIVSSSNAYGGKQYAKIPQANFDTTAEYTVTYVALDKHLLSSHPTSVKLTYANNIRSALEDAVGKVQDNSTQLSVHEKAIVDLYVRVKAIGG